LEGGEEEDMEEVRRDNATDEDESARCTTTGSPLALGWGGALGSGRYFYASSSLPLLLPALLLLPHGRETGRTPPAVYFARAMRGTGDTAGHVL
jgi:hypothetical protein